MENWKAITFLLASGQGFILSLALIVKGLKTQRASLFLGLIIYVFAQEMLNAWGIQVRYHRQPTSIPFWNFQSYLLLPLSLWFFGQLTSAPGYTFKRKYALFFLPVVIEWAIRFAWQMYRRHTREELPSLLDNPVWFSITEILPIIGMVVVLSIYGKQLFAFRSSLLRRQPSLAFMQYFRIYGLFSFMAMLTVLWIAGVVFRWPVFSGIEALLTVLLFGMGYIGYLDPGFFTLPAVPDSRVVEKPDFAQFDDALHLKRLHAAFREGALYTQSKLTVEDVASTLQLPARYVSYLINTYCATNFNAFVNAFRVEEVIRKLGDPREQHKTVLALAFEAGFNSKSTFNQVFRQHTGKSPSQYLLVKSKISS